jgi:hypothetical protein
MQDIEDVSNFTEPVPGLQDAVDALNEANLNAVFQALANRTRKLKDDQTAHASTPAPHSDHETPAGAQAKVDAHDDLTAPHSATATPIANRLPKYDASGRLEAIAGIAGNDVVNFGQFVAAKTASGYQKLPSGLIIQFFDLTITTNEIQTYSFPIAFPTACLNMQVANRTSLVFALIEILSNTQFTANRDNGSSGTTYYYGMAIGY